jgi:two-component system LytT family sensor kinase
MAAIASVVARSNSFKSMLMRESRTLPQRLGSGAVAGVVFASSVAVRVAGPQQLSRRRSRPGRQPDRRLLGGYVTGLVSGILISLPAFFHGEYLTLPLLASGRRAGRAAARPGAHPEEVWRFSPFPTSTSTASSRKSATTGAPASN